ncbi:MAG: DNA double-strand break repair nuclease NurA [Candidatus Nitrosocosmicus sp.]
MNNQLNFQQLQSNLDDVKKLLFNNFNNSLFCKDYKKLLKNKKLVFVGEDDSGIPIQNWDMRSDKYNQVKVNKIDIVEKEKFVFGIDSSCIKIAEVEDGGLYAIKGSTCVSFRGCPVTHFKIGPFLFYLNEDTLKNFQLDQNVLKLLLYNDDYAKKFLRVNFERYIQYWLSKTISNSVILIDGSLKYSIFENRFYSILKIIENSVINKNLVIGVSKNTKIKILKYFSYPLLNAQQPSFININLIISSIIRRIYGEHVLIKFDENRYSSILRADLVMFEGGDDGSSGGIAESLGILLFNEFITNGYPSTLQLSHHVSTFSNTDLSSIQSFIKSNYFIKELYNENVRSSVLGSIWK